MPVPEAFINEMKQLWQNYNIPGTFTDFLDSLDQPPVKGLRSNGLKITPLKLSTMLEDTILLNDQETASPRMVPWNNDGFYVQTEKSAGKTPAYHAGLFYIQEPSAMLPAKVLAANPGENILDLCAAPGGKTAKIAADLAGEGILWANEISSDRAKALLRNVELMGCTNCIISQETPERLAEHLPAFFDRILVDAPCSGSGMFRRDNQAAASWEKFGVEHCVYLQKDILTAADKMLKSGGWLVYSTCSFSLAEDEAMIKDFLLKHPEYKIVSIEGPGLSPGLEFDGDVELTRTVRIWPHITEGDGHFCALLYKQEKTDNNNHRIQAVQQINDVNSKKNVTSGHVIYRSKKARSNEEMIIQVDMAIKYWLKWSENVLSETGKKKMIRLLADWEPRLHNNHLQLLPPNTPSFDGLKMVKTGFYLGHFKTKTKYSSSSNDRIKQKMNESRLIFEPAHSWFTALHAEDFACTLRLEQNNELLLRFLRGETLMIDISEITTFAGKLVNAGDLVVVCLNEHPVGYTKMQQGTLKNMYPPAWRLRG